MMRFATFAVVLFAVVLSLGVGEQAPAGADANRPSCETGNHDCFGLWTSCGRIRYYVGLSKSEDSALGLTSERVENAVESRLRAARMLAAADNSNVQGFLNVEIVSVGRSRYATSVNVAFYKWLFDRSSRLTNPPMLGQGMNRGFASSYEVGVSSNRCG